MNFKNDRKGKDFKTVAVIILISCIQSRKELLDNGYNYTQNQGQKE